MTLINWDGPYYYIDPSDFSITPAGGTPTAGEEVVPTYGLNGGPGWTVGVVGGSTLGGGRPGPQYESTLDKLFFFHDRAYDLNPQPILPDADLKLINDMAKLSDRQLADPEDSFYAGIVTLALLTRLAEDAPTSLPSLPKIAFITLDALHNIERGLAGLPPTEQ